MEIEDDNFDEEVRSRLRTLDDVYPPGLEEPGVLWAGISGARRRRHNRVRVVWGAAACIAVLAVAGWWRQGSSPTTEPYSVGAEWQDSGSVHEQEALTYVMQLCRGNHVGCATDDFKALEADLADAELSLEQVTRDIARFGDDERLIRARDRIKDQQAHIIRAMVQML